MSEKVIAKKINVLISKNNKGLFFMSIFFSFIIALFEITLAFILMMLIDKSQEGVGAIFQVLIYTVIGAGLYVLVGILNTKTNSLYIKNAVCNLRNSLMDSIIYKSMNEISERPLGSYIAILNNDLLNVETNYIATTVPVIKNTVMIIAAVLAMFSIEWRLTIGVAIMLVLPLIVSWGFGNKLKNSQRSITDSTHNLNAFIKDTLSGIAVIKSFNIEKQVSQILAVKSNDTENDKCNYSNTLGLQSLMMLICSLMLIVLIFSFGTYLTIRGYTTLGGVIAFVQLLNNLTGPMGTLFTAISKRRSCGSIFKVFHEILKETAGAERNSRITQLAEGIRLTDVSFTVNQDTTLLHHINYSFKKGESYAIVGLSGSGKSTLLSLLAGYYSNYTGNIKYDDCEVRNISEQSLYQLISLVQQDSFIFNDTLENNIKLFKDWPEAEVKQAVRGAHLDGLIADRGYDLNCGESGSRLSGGEKQRISIARALLKNSKVLLLDEATSALDVSTSAAIEDTLSALEDTIKIVITHKLDETLLKKYDAIIMMKDGRIVESGTYCELMSNQGYLFALKQVNTGN